MTDFMPGAYTFEITGTSEHDTKIATFTLTLDDLCASPILTPFTDVTELSQYHDTMPYYIYVFPVFTYAPTQCLVPITYTCANTISPDGRTDMCAVTTVPGSVAIFDPDPTGPSYSIASAPMTDFMPGAYTFDITGTSEHDTKITTFTLTLDDLCASPILTAFADVNSEQYLYTSPAYLYDFPAFTFTPSQCFVPIIYTCVNMFSPDMRTDMCDVTTVSGSIAYFDPVALSYTIYSIDKDDFVPGVYTFEITGTSEHDTQTTTFTLALFNPCFTSTLVLDPSSTVFPSPALTTVIFQPQSTLSWDDTIVNESVTSGFECGAMVYSFTKANGAALEPIYDDSTAYELKVYTDDDVDAKTYNIIVTVVYVDYPAVSAQKQFSIIIYESCAPTSVSLPPLQNDYNYILGETLTTSQMGTVTSVPFYCTITLTYGQGVQPFSVDDSTLMESNGDGTWTIDSEDKLLIGKQWLAYIIVIDDAGYDWSGDILSQMTPQNPSWNFQVNVLDPCAIDFITVPEEIGIDDNISILNTVSLYREIDIFVVNAPYSNQLCNFTMTYDLYVNGTQFEVSTLASTVTFGELTDDEEALIFTARPGILPGIYNMEIRSTLPDLRSDIVCTDTLLLLDQQSCIEIECCGWDGSSCLSIMGMEPCPNTGLVTTKPFDLTIAQADIPPSVAPNSPPQIESFRNYYNITRLVNDEGISLEDKSFQLFLGTVVDNENDSIEGSITSDEDLKFFQYDDDSRVILVSSQAAAGNYTMTLILKDNNVYSLSVSYELQIELMNIVVFNVNATQMMDELVDDDAIQPTLFIERISNEGLMYVKFSEDFNLWTNLTQINSTVLNLQVIPGDADVNMATLQFTWEVIQFQKTGMSMQLYFNSAIFISTQGQRDKLRLTVKDPIPFRAEKSMLYIPYDFVSSTNIPAQLPMNAATETLKSVTATFDSATQGSLISNFALNIAISGALNYLWGMVNCLQIIAHFPMINVLMPANVQMLFMIVVKIATFDMLPVGGIMEWFDETIPTTSDPYAMPANFQEFGYETTNTVQNLEVVFLVILILSILPGIVVLLDLLLSCLPKAQSTVQKFKNENIYWNIYLRFLIESYLELSIACLIRIQAFKFETITDTTLTCFSFIIFIVLIFSMVGTPLFLVSNHKNIRKKEFKDTYGSLSLGLTHREKAALYYPCVFMARRMIYSMVIILLTNRNYFQIQILVFMQSMVMAFQGQVCPFAIPAHNKMDLFNEMMTLLSTYGLFIFTEFVPDPIARYQFGWCVIFITLGILAFNILVLLITSLTDSCRKNKIRKSKKAYMKIMKQRKQEQELIEARLALVNAQMDDPLRQPMSFNNYGIIEPRAFPLKRTKMTIRKKKLQNRSTIRRKEIPVPKEPIAPDQFPSSMNGYMPSQESNSGMINSVDYSSSLSEAYDYDLSPAMIKEQFEPVRPIGYLGNGWDAYNLRHDDPDSEDTLQKNDDVLLRPQPNVPATDDWNFRNNSFDLDYSTSLKPNMPSIIDPYQRKRLPLTEPTKQEIGDLSSLQAKLDEELFLGNEEIKESYMRPRAVSVWPY